ncbi:MAG: hypothetical protein AB9842_03635 [Bacteroidales bacterium]
MKKVITIGLLSLLAAYIVSAQESKKSVQPDSILYKGKYYRINDPDYAGVKIKHEKSNFETAFMPGLSFNMYQPKDKDSAGVFTGFAVEYLLYAKIYQNNKPGPSHVRWYARFNMLNSDKDDISDLFSYSLGLSLSIEKNPGRVFLVPYFGLEFGGLSQRKWGTTAQFTPTVGIHLISQKNLFINFQGGYIYPVSNFDLLKGWIFQSGINFALW